MKNVSIIGRDLVRLLVLTLLAHVPEVLGAPAAGRTFNGVYYASGTLGYALESTYQTLTNSRPGYRADNDQPWTGFVWGSTNITGWRWSSNSIIFGKRGYTAISAAQFGGTQARTCLLTRRHAVTAGHYGQFPAGSVVWFLGTNNVPHAMTVARTIASQSGEDRAVVIFTQDVPRDVQPMRVAGPIPDRSPPSIFGITGEYFPPISDNPYRAYPVFFICQHGFLGRHRLLHPNGLIGIDRGDSGSPGFMILNNELFYVGGISMHGPSQGMLREMDELSRHLKLDPSAYQPESFSITNFAAWSKP